MECSFEKDVYWFNEYGDVCSREREKEKGVHPLHGPSFEEIAPSRGIIKVW